MTTSTSSLRSCAALHITSVAFALAVSLVTLHARAEAPSTIEPLPPAPPVAASSPPASPAAPAAPSAHGPTVAVSINGAPCVAPDPCTTPPRDKGGAETHVEYNPNDGKLMHGFRIGYSATLNYDKQIAALDGQSLQQKVNMRSPNHMLVGYEAFYRVVGHSWLNVIMVANANVAGLEESHFFPSGNLLLGGELNNSFQLGLGVHLEPLKGSEAHTILAAGWTPRVGTFYVPVHAFFIPDVDGVHRVGLTTGVTW